MMKMTFLWKICLLVVLLLACVSVSSCNSDDGFEEEFEREFASASGVAPPAAPETVAEDQTALPTHRHHHHAQRQTEFDEDEFEDGYDEFELPKRESVRFVVQKDLKQQPKAATPSSEQVEAELDDKEDEIQSQQQEIDSPTVRFLHENLPKSVANVASSVVLFFAVRDFTIELYFLGFYVIYFIIFYFGSQYNLKLAKSWAGKYLPMLRQQFASVPPLTRNSAYSYSLRASGRANTLGVQMDIDFLRRQDLISYVLGKFLGWRDTIKFEFPLRPNIEPFVLAVVKDKQKAKFLQDNEVEFSNCKKYYRDELPLWCILSDNPEANAAVLTPAVTASLKKHGQYINLIRVTDDHALFEHKKILTIDYSIPNNFDEFETLFHMTFFILDNLGRFHFSKEGSKIAKKMRFEKETKAKKALQESREEAAQQRKLKKKKEEKERISQLPLDQQEKYLEKERKKELKKKMAGRTKMLKA